MKNILYGVVFLFALLLTVSAGHAQGVKTGGYKEIAKTDSGAKEAADFAVEAETKKSGRKIELDSVHKAERQSVAGTNYRLCLKVNTEGAEGQDDAPVFVQTVIYVDLKQTYKLTSWEASDCGEDVNQVEYFNYRSGQASVRIATRPRNRPRLSREIPS